LRAHVDPTEARTLEDQGQFSREHDSGHWSMGQPASCSSGDVAFASNVFLLLGGRAGSISGWRLGQARGRRSAAPPRTTPKEKRMGYAVSAYAPWPEETLPESPPSRHRRIASSRARPGGWGSGSQGGGTMRMATSRVVALCVDNATQRVGRLGRQGRTMAACYRPTTSGTSASRSPPAEGTELEPAPGHYKHMLGLPL
jgi:hypothetical protein